MRYTCLYTCLERVMVDVNLTGGADTYKLSPTTVQPPNILMKSIFLQQQQLKKIKTWLQHPNHIRTFLE